MKNFLTYGQLESILLQLSGKSGNDVDPNLRRSIINTKLYKVFQYIDGQNDRQYNRILDPIVVAQDSAGQFFFTISDIYVREIVRIWAGTLEVEPVPDAREFAKLGDSFPFWEKRAAYYQLGDRVYVFFGQKVTANINGLKMEYRGKPIPYTAETVDTSIDIPPEFNQQLIDECVVMLVGQVAPDVQERLDGYERSYAAQQRRLTEKASKKENRE